MSGGEEAKGLAWGFAGVALFSLTLPATRAAVAHLDPVFVALGRALLAAACAAAVLAITRTRRPTPAEWRLLALSASGVVFGFPLFTTWAMRHVPASHGAVVLAVLPLATAAAGAIVARERPSPGFWIVGVAGSLVVLAFALREGGGGVAAADLALLAAVVSAALGYALGARAAATMGGWQAISWSLVLCIPVLAPLVLLNLPATPRDVPAGAWAGFLYVALVSQYLLLRVVPGPRARRHRARGPDAAAAALPHDRGFRAARRRGASGRRARLRLRRGRAGGPGPPDAGQAALAGGRRRMRMLPATDTATPASASRLQRYPSNSEETPSATMGMITPV